MKDFIFGISTQTKNRSRHAKTTKRETDEQNIVNPAGKRSRSEYGHFYSYSF